MTLKVTSAVISWGPCWWKTSGMTHTVSEITEKVPNSKVIIVPEAATQLFEMWIEIWWKNWLSNEAFQDLIIKQQLHNELTAKRIIKNISSDIDHLILLHDRWLLDWAAYTLNDDQTINRKLFEALLNQNNTKKIEDWYDNYNAILHYQSTAIGAEEFFTNKNNTHRKEDIKQARIQDELTQQARIWHPHFRILTNENNKTFHDKLTRWVNEILNLIGYPETFEREDRYTIDKIDLNNQIFKNAIKSTIEQIYIYHQNPSATNRIRKRTRNEESLYTQTIKTNKHGQPIEEERSISEKEYKSMMAFQLPDTIILRKDRYNFLRKDQYMELDYFHNGKMANEYKLECEKSKQNDIIEIPDFIQIKENVTGDKRYSNKELASIK